jgi:hypothetical protein
MMRFHPGSVVISENTDLPILRKVFQAGHVTVRQLYRALGAGFDKNAWDSFNRRTRVLSSSGFLIRESYVGMDSHVLSLGEEGAVFLRGRETTIVEAISRRSRSGDRDQVWHDVELFELQLALRKAGVVGAWQFEPEIRADNDFTTYRYVKDYDAVVTFHCAGKSAKVALEYERTPKTSRAYERIAALLSHETRISSVIYVVCNLQMESFLLHALRKARKPMYVCQVHELASEPAGARLIDVQHQRQWRLKDCLE